MNQFLNFRRGNHTQKTIWIFVLFIFCAVVASINAIYYGQKVISDNISKLVI